MTTPRFFSTWAGSIVKAPAMSASAVRPRATTSGLSAGTPST
jgi:hypothetical protein